MLLSLVSLRTSFLTTHCSSLKPVFVLLALFWLRLIAPDSCHADSDEFSSVDRSAIDEQFATKLSELAAKCEQLGIAEQAKVSRQWHLIRDPGRTYLFLPADYAPQKQNANEPNVVTKWRARFQSLRDEHADHLFDLAKQCHEQRPDLAFQLLHEVLRENPQHKEARRTLGHTRTAQGWDVPSKRIKSTAGTVVHPRYGWRRGSYWRIESEHFRILTNHSAKEGVALAELLEDFHAVWRQIFFRYWSSASSLAARLAGRDERLGRSPPFNIVLFRSRDEYLGQLSKIEPQIAVSLGYYLDKQRTAFFYAGEGSDVATWLHEVTHQLFQETESAVDEVGKDADAWIIEGIAQYMESFQRHDGYVTVGGIDADRLQFARARTLTGEFAMPLAELVPFNRDRLKGDSRIRLIYSHAAGLCHFLMDHNQGQYRNATIDYLGAIYSGQSGKRPLDRLAKRSYAELDSEFKDYLLITDDDLRPFAYLPLRRNLYLSGTRVTDQGLGFLKNTKSIEWLDLSHLSITDEGFSVFKEASGMRQLSLEETHVTSDSLRWLANFQQLEELDLSGTNITDSSLLHVKDLIHLKTLWLTNTPISDQGLPHLKNLIQLEKLDLAGTLVTEAGRMSLRRTLRNWKEE